MEWPYSGILLLTLIPSADGRMKPVSPKTEEKSQTVDSCDIKRLLSCWNYCTIKISQARQSDCDWLGHHICCWEMGAEGLHLRRREGTYWSFALCSSAFINHWALLCALFLKWKWLLLLCLVWTVILWVHVRQACEVKHPQGDWGMSICWFWHGIMKIYGHISMKNNMILRWSGNFFSQSNIHVGTLLCLSYTCCILDQCPVSIISMYLSIRNRTAGK